MYQDNNKWLLLFNNIYNKCKLMQYWNNILFETVFIPRTKDYTRIIYILIQKIIKK